MSQASDSYVRFLESHPEMEDATDAEKLRAWEANEANKEAARIDWLRMVAKEGR